jgi:hypothetical protein
MIRKRNGKWVLLTSDGKRVLGTHPTEKAALAQERAIQISKRTRRIK